MTNPPTIRNARIRALEEPVHGLPCTDVEWAYDRQLGWSANQCRQVRAFEVGCERRQYGVRGADRWVPRFRLVCKQHAQAFDRAHGVGYFESDAHAPVEHFDDDVLESAS